MNKGLFVKISFIRTACESLSKDEINNVVGHKSPVVSLRLGNYATHLTLLDLLRNWLLLAVLEGHLFRQAS
jgi:hypothetical protein